MFEKIPLAGVGNMEWLRLRKSGIGGLDGVDISWIKKAAREVSKDENDYH